MSVNITPQDLAQAIEDLDGFDHEMRVRYLLTSLRRASVSHGGSYLDPVEHKPRQFDLRVLIHNEHAPRFMYLAIECKRLSREAPLVISGTARANREAVHYYVISDFTSPTDRELTASLGEVTHRNKVYKEGAFVGKSLLRLKPHQSGKGFVRGRNSDDIYPDWTQALSSAHELCQMGMYFASASRPRTESFVLPAVVVPNGTLWRMGYDETGKPNGLPEHTATETLYVNHRVKFAEMGKLVVGYGALSHVHFFTVDGLKQFIDELLTQGNLWDEWFPSDAEKIPFRSPLESSAE